MSLLVTLGLRRVTGVIILLVVGILCLVTLRSWSPSHILSPMSSPGGIPLLPPTCVPTNQSDDTSVEQRLPCPLQVYHRQQQSPQPFLVEPSSASTSGDLPP